MVLYVALRYSVSHSFLMYCTLFAAGTLALGSLYKSNILTLSNWTCIRTTNSKRDLFIFSNQTASRDIQEKGG